MKYEFRLMFRAFILDQLPAVVLGGVFIYFGFDKIENPASWASYVPPFASHTLPFLINDTFLQAQGVVEILLGLGMIIPKSRRVAGGAAAAVLIAVVASLFFIGGINLALRDMVLLAVALTLAVK